MIKIIFIEIQKMIFNTNRLKDKKVKYIKAKMIIKKAKVHLSKMILLFRNTMTKRKIHQFLNKNQSQKRNRKIQ